MVTISTVEATRPEKLTDTAHDLGPKVGALASVIAAQRRALEALTTAWRGGGADAAAGKAEADLGRQQAVVTRLTAMRSAVSSAGTNLAALRTEILAMRHQVAALGGAVAEDGTVTPRVAPFGTMQLLTPAVCHGYTQCFHALLTQFDNIDRATAASLTDSQSAAADRMPGGPTWTGDDLYGGDPDGTGPRGAGPKLSDVNQNALGDCYLAATMGSIAQADPQWIKDRITYDPQTGEFDVTLWDGRQWQHLPVTQADIDANIAARGGSGVDTGDPTAPDLDAPLWPAVIESAYGKMTAPGRAPYTGIGQGGHSKDAMEALTGNRGAALIPAQEWYRTQHIDRQIAAAIADHQPVVLSTTDSTGATGLVEKHVYSVVGISGAGSDAVVTLQNPWEPGPGASGVATVRLGDLMGSGLTGALGNGPVQNVNIGRLGQ